jgi:hypothetical protein
MQKSIELMWNGYVAEMEHKRATIKAQIDVYASLNPDILSDASVKAVLEKLSSKTLAAIKPIVARKVPEDGMRCEHVKHTAGGGTVQCVKMCNEKWSHEGRNFCNSHTTLPEVVAKRAATLRKAQETKAASKAATAAPVAAAAPPVAPPAPAPAEDDTEDDEEDEDEMPPCVYKFLYPDNSINDTLDYDEEANALVDAHGTPIVEFTKQNIINKKHKMTNKDKMYLIAVLGTDDVRHVYDVTKNAEETLVTFKPIGHLTKDDEFVKA